MVICGLPRVERNELFVFRGTSSDLEAAVPIRLTSEAREFVAAKGPPLQIAFESSLMVFGSSDLEVTESELHVSQVFPSPLHESLAIAENMIRGVAVEHTLNILRAAPVLGHLENAELFEANGLSELVQRMSLGQVAIRLAVRDVPVRFESLERVSWALGQLLMVESGATFHLLDDDDFTDRDLIEWLAHRFKVPSPVSVGERRLKFADTWSGIPGAELTFGSRRRHLKLAGDKIFRDKLVSSTEDYLRRWISPE